MKKVLIALVVILGLASCGDPITGTVKSKEKFTVTSSGVTTVHFQLHLTSGKTTDVPESVYNKCKKGDKYDGVKCG